MKNIHVLPTDKPSRLHEYSNIPFLGLSKEALNWKEAQHIYITSDVADINENNYIITIDGRLVQVSYLLSKDLEGASKVILTTDQDLIKDGVQAIDDDFLEWFVKNPSCEEVEVDRDEREVGNHLGGVVTEYGDYKIIIPKEEPKQEQLDELDIFFEGVTWKQEQDKNKYSEEEVRQMLWDLGDVLFNNNQNGIKEGDPEKYIEEIIEQFKNK